MNINVYIEESLSKQLNACAKSLHRPRNAIIREALKEWLDHHQKKSWPASILKFKGIPNAPAFESFREELTPPPEDPLA